MIEKTEIVVDHRERKSGVVEKLVSFEGVSVVMRQLAVGDYCVDGTALFERKRAVDFARSLLDGRLFEQASLLALTVFRPALLIEGSASEWSGLSIKREAIQGALITLSLVFEIPVFRAIDAAESAALLVYTGRQFARLRDPHSVAFRHGKGRRIRTRQSRVVQSLPGIGPHRAEELLRRFGSVRACFMASAEELQKIAGIGAKASKAIADLLDERYIDGSKPVAR